MKLKTFAVGIMAMALSATTGHAAEKKAKGAGDAETQAMMAKMMQLGSPSAGHAVLKAFEGNWTVVTKGWMKPGDKPMESTGTSQFSWVLGGRYLRQDFKGTWAGQPFEGLGFSGYDNMKAEYVN